MVKSTDNIGGSASVSTTTTGKIYTDDGKVVSSVTVNKSVSTQTAVTIVNSSTSNTSNSSSQSTKNQSTGNNVSTSQGTSNNGSLIDTIKNSDFLAGVTASLDNNITFGAAQSLSGTIERDSTEFYLGKVTGDVLSLATGGGIITGGVVGEAGGLALDATGAGAILGVPINVASFGAIVSGGTIVVTSSINLFNDAQDLIASITKSGGGSSGFDKQKNGTPGNNQAQNKQVNDIVKKWGLNKDEQRELHDEITGRNLSYKEIEEIAKQVVERE